LWVYPDYLDDEVVDNIDDEEANAHGYYNDEDCEKKSSFLALFISYEEILKSVHVSSFLSNVPSCF
jgi:hypothetical protein